MLHIFRPRIYFNSWPAVNCSCKTHMHPPLRRLHNARRAHYSLVRLFTFVPRFQASYIDPPSLDPSPTDPRKASPPPPPKTALRKVALLQIRKSATTVIQISCMPRRRRNRREGGRRIYGFASQKAIQRMHDLVGTQERIQLAPSLPMDVAAAAVRQPSSSSSSKPKPQTLTLFMGSVVARCRRGSEPLENAAQAREQRH